MSPASQSSSLAQPTLPSPHLKSGVHLLQQHLSVLVSPWRGGIAFTHHLLRVVRVLLYRIPGPLYTVGPAHVECSTVDTVSRCFACSLGSWGCREIMTTVCDIFTCPCVQGVSGLQRLVQQSSEGSQSPPERPQLSWPQTSAPWQSASALQSPSPRPHGVDPGLQVM